MSGCPEDKSELQGFGFIDTCTLPLVDLNDVREYQNVVDFQKDVYLGHTTTVLLDDNTTILLVYPQGHAKGPILYKRSEDGGITWSDCLPVPVNWQKSDNVPTIYKMTDAKGKERIILVSGMLRVNEAISEDNGKTWSDLTPIADWGGIVAFSTVVPLKTPGHYMALFHDFFGPELDGTGPFMCDRIIKKYESDHGVKMNGFVQYKTFTADGGMTWSDPEVIGFSSEVFLCEPCGIRSPDGNQIAVIWRENKRVKNSMITFSNDEGKNWSEPKEVPLALTGDRHTAKYLNDGRLFISFRDRAPQHRLKATDGDWVAWVGNYQDLVDGTQGDFRIRLLDNNGVDCGYPGVEILSDGTIFTVTYGKWKPDEKNYIMSVRFNLDNLIKRMSRK